MEFFPQKKKKNYGIPTKDIAVKNKQIEKWQVR
jgi:hypothetical protein